MHEAMINQLYDIFGSRIQENVCMANYTTMNVGGEADALSGCEDDAITRADHPLNTVC